MKRLFKFGWLLSLVLAACTSGGGPGPTPNPTPSSLYTEGNVYGTDLPEGAQTLSPEEFEAKVKSGEISLITKKDLDGQEASWKAQFAQDQAKLQAIPPDQQSPDVKALLSQDVNLPQTPGGDYVAEFKNSDGSSFKVVTMGKQSRMRQLVDALEKAGNPDNALEAYRSVYESAPQSALEGQPSPDSLKGKSASEIMDALYKLDDALAKVPNLDGARGEDPASGALSSQSGPGNGVDSSGNCTPKAGGIYSNFWWPLKRFTTGVRDQGFRGTCWGFAAVAALESREMVVSDATLNLSEQFFVNKNKRNYAPSDFGDGYGAEVALQNFLSANERVPGEGAWTYNRALNRPGNAFDSGVAGTAASYKNACQGYSGFCSETAHESPKYCTQVKLFGITLYTYCGYYNVVNGAGGVVSSSTTTLWHNQWSNLSASTRRGYFPQYTLRSLLANGQALLASFGVYEGWDGVSANGFVTNFGTANGRGGHVVLITGYVSNSVLAQRLPNAPQGAGGGYFIIKNSWGCGPADAGFYYVPTDYITKVFSDISRLNMPATRSNRWKTQVQGGGGNAAPTVKITAPVVASSDDLFQLPNYLNFQNSYTFTARVDDKQDGNDCCASSVIWKSQKRGQLGTGKSISVALAASGSDDVISATGKDSDGNTATVSVNLRDGQYPLVSILFPTPNATINRGQATTLQGRAVQFLGGTGDSDLPCPPPDLDLERGR